MELPYDFFENGFGYIRLENIKLAKLPESINVDGDELVIKPEFHISLVWAGRLSEMIDKENKQKIKAEMIEEFDRFIEEYSLEGFELTKELRFVRHGEQKSVIVMVDMPNLAILFERLSQKYGVKLPLQPAHITLYTLPTDKIGIGVFSYEELAEKTEPLNIPEIEQLLARA